MVCKRAWLIPAIMTIVIGMVFLYSTPVPKADYIYYQSFIEALARGHIDMSIIGFHGSDFLALPWYLVTRSSFALIGFQKFCALCLPTLSYLVGKKWFGTRGGILFCCMFLFPPFMPFLAYQGWTYPSYFCLIFLGFLFDRGWGWLPLSIAIVTKPFAVIFLPFLKRWWLALLIPIAYVCFEYVQVGQIQVGVHQGTTASNAFPLDRLTDNLIFGFQTILSVHRSKLNASVGIDDMIHTSPLVVFLGLRGLIETGYLPTRLRLLLGSSFVMGLALNFLLADIDTNYLDTPLLCLILASIPVMLQSTRWIPLVGLTMFFPWWYFLLGYYHSFALPSWFYVWPSMAFLLSLIPMSATVTRWFECDELPSGKKARA